MPTYRAGDFTLLVQSRDIFGQVKDLDPLLFKVLPPYWQRPWFYALEFFVFAGLVLISFRLKQPLQDHQPSLVVAYDHHVDSVYSNGDRANVRHEE